MNCQDVLSLLHPYCDGELDLVRHLQIEQHLAECASCAEQEQHLQSLRTALASPSLYHRAPDSLRTLLQSTATTAAQATVRHGRSARQRVTMAASVLLLIGTSATISGLYFGAGPSADDRLVASVVADHIRSIQVDHLTDVVSSDRHTVKPWFQGKLDFAPNVPDLSVHGYTLSGGRLDYLIDRPVPALVYYRRLHAINVFIRPAANTDDKPIRRLTQQGFHLRQWQQSGMIYWVISDLNDEELDEFVKHFREG